MKILLTSDIHGHQELLNYIISNYDADLYYDCGDSELMNFNLKDFYSVMGNCDYEFYPNYRVVNIDEGLNIFITHGHLYSYETMIEMAKQKKCNVVAFGHYHVRRLEEVDGIYLINPGSVSKPRDKHGKSFACINYNPETKEISFEFIKINL